MHAVIGQLPCLYQAMQTRLWRHSMHVLFPLSYVMFPLSYFIKEIENGRPGFK